MSNIYISEPPTDGKVCLVTTAGDIDIELWSRETPKACRNFVQLCMEGYYDETMFHRLVKGFIVQGGDPTGTGQGGQSIYGHTFKDEYHQRLKFVRRGLVAMANAGVDDNGSQFFFTLGPTQELQNKHTIFGKVVGDTLYNMIKLEESPIDEGDRPLYPHKIIKTKILNNPFNDIIPRQIKKKSSKNKSKSKSNSVATKNFSLLSFGAEAEEEEDEIESINKKFSGKGKSSHDLLKNDKKLSKEALILPKKELAEDSSDEDELDSDSDLKADVRENSDQDEDHEDKQDLKNVVQNKLKKSKESSKSKSKKDKKVSDDDDIEEDYLGKGDDDKRKNELLKIKEEMRQLKNEMKQKDRQKAEEKTKKEVAEQEAVKKKQQLEENTLIKSFFDEQKKYREKLGQTKKDKGDREAQTLKLLAKFQQKLHKEKEIAEERHQDGVVKDNEQEQEEDEKDDPSDLSWLSKPLENKEEIPILAKDANLKSDDWFDIHDPRASVNKRRRNSPSLKDPSKKYRPSRVTD